MSSFQGVLIREVPLYSAYLGIEEEVGRGDCEGGNFEGVKEEVLAPGGRRLDGLVDTMVEARREREGERVRERGEGFKENIKFKTET